MTIPDLQFPLRIQQGDQQTIYDPIRKNFFLLTPEEWVRQHVLHLLIHEKKIAKGRIAVERKVKNSNKRFDILIHDATTGFPQLIVECKSYSETIGQTTFRQIAQYNLNLQVPYLVITNWHQWMAAEIDFKNSNFEFLDNFPDV